MRYNGYMIKIDIISGFLGAGKTTFANMLLRHYFDMGLRPVFIVNEFGQTGLDADIIQAEGFNALKMEGGCICCTLKNDISVAILQVIETFSPSNIVFEPSGIFVFNNFFDILKEPAIATKCVLGCVLTVVDSINFSLAKVQYGSFMFNQIKHAKVVLLSKLERAQAWADELICDIKNINPDALIVLKAWEEWIADDFGEILGQNSFLEDYQMRHHDNLQSMTITLQTLLTQVQIDQLVSGCISGKFGDLCRVKGIIATSEKLVLLQIVMQDVSQNEFRGPGSLALTFIGQTVDSSALRSFFAAI